MPDAPSEPAVTGPPSIPQASEGRAPLVDWLYAQSQYGRWGLPARGFQRPSNAARKTLPLPDADSPSTRGIPLRAPSGRSRPRLCLARRMRAGWEHFFATYRPYLRTAARPFSVAIQVRPSVRTRGFSFRGFFFYTASRMQGQRSFALPRYFHGRQFAKDLAPRVSLSATLMRSARAAARRNSAKTTHRIRASSPVWTATHPGDPHRDVPLLVWPCSERSPRKTRTQERERLRPLLHRRENPRGDWRLPRRA